MKILYAIQGTGNGHICRAAEIIPYLQQYGELDILVSGTQSDLELPFKVDYAFKGLSFVFGRKGGIDYLNTYINNHINQFIKEVKKIPVENYDLVLNDFEPLSAWACYFKGKACVGLSNQVAIKVQPLKKKLNDDLIGRFIINHYAPTTSEYGFHYQSFAPHVFTPIIRREVRKLKVSNNGHYTVYLPSYHHNRIIKKLSLIEGIKWEVFSKHTKSEVLIGNFHVRPIQHEAFLKSMASSSGVICAAGFGTSSEALYLGKKLLVIPQKKQYEQLCNAAALKKMGIEVVKHLRKKHLHKIERWVKKGEPIQVDYPDQTKLIVETIINNEVYFRDNYLDYLTNSQFDVAI